MNESEAVFRGTLDECLRHFANAFNLRYPRGIKGSSEARIPLAEFCGIAEQTTRIWLYGQNHKFSAMTRMALSEFLRIQGYHVREWENMNDQLRLTAEILIYHLLDIPTLRAGLGYATDHQVMRLITHGGPSDKMELLFQICRPYLEMLAEAKSKAAVTYIIPIEPLDEQTGPVVLTGRALRHAEGVLDVMSGLCKLLKGRPLHGLTQDELEEIDPKAVSNILDLTQHLGELGRQLLDKQAG